MIGQPAARDGSARGVCPGRKPPGWYGVSPRKGAAMATCRPNLSGVPLGAASPAGFSRLSLSARRL